MGFYGLNDPTNSVKAPKNVQYAREWAEWVSSYLMNGNGGNHLLFVRSTNTYGKKKVLKFYFTELCKFSLLQYACNYIAC